MLIDDLFYTRTAKSSGFVSYQMGTVPFVSNGFRNNGIIGLVKPKSSDRVFDFEGICISAFCEATVHKPPYIPRGNGGSGLTVLEPKERMDFETLIYVASYINSTYRWKFSYGRMVVKNRIHNLKIVIPDSIKSPQSISDLMPKNHKLNIIEEKIKFKQFGITDFFDLERGDFHALDKLDIGKYPTISRVTFDNGVEGFYDKPKNAKVYPKGTITISSTSGDAFLQLDDFISTDNVLILVPKQNFCIEELLFITIMLNLEKWRISYGRQGYKGLFAKTKIFLPVNIDNSLNIEYMKKIIKNAYHFDMVRKCLTS